MNKKELILVIEDEEIIASMLKDNLEQLGYNVIVANSGVEGLKRIDNIQPDLITLDIMMPGLDGIQVLKELKNNKSTKDIPVILLSVASDSSRNEGLKLGAIAFYKKPLDFKQLNRKIKSVTKKKTVLVVDDDMLILKIIESKLISQGYKVVCASDGNEAIMKAKKVKPDIILMDYLLPDKDGLEVIKVLKQSIETSDIPIIAFSGNIEETFDSQEILGVDKFLGKKFSAEDLAEEVNKVFKKEIQ